MTWILAIYLPFAAAFIVLYKPLAPSLRPLLCTLSVVPSLALVVFPSPADGITVPFLFLQTVLGLDTVRQIFLLFTALLWLVAGIYAAAYLRQDPRQRIFFFLYLLTMSGNIGLILAEDIVSFYTFFALMTFAAYGLVVYDGTPRAHHAGFIYIIMAVIGEAFLLAAILIAVSTTETTIMSGIRQALPVTDQYPVVIFCTFMGFGVKAGVLGIHMWLPLAHPVAPTPASAVLSGTMIKAGLLGWMNLFPLGYLGSVPWGNFLIIAGLGAAIYAVIAGLPQDEAKTNLAYSSISQMGLMTVGVGIGLAEPEVWPLLAPIIGVYALSHGLAKGTLFLGVGIAHRADNRTRQMVTMAVLIVAAATIAGAPFTGGAVAKKALKGMAGHAHIFSLAGMELLLTLTAAGTTLLLGRFLLLVWNDMRQSHSAERGTGLLWPWLVLPVPVMFGAWFTVAFYGLEIDLPGPTITDTWAAVWPMLSGAVILLVLIRSFGSHRIPYSVKPGDIILWFEAAGRQVSRIWQRTPAAREERWQINLEPYVRMVVESERKQHLMNRTEESLAAWDVAGVVFVCILLAFIILNIVV